MRLLLLSSSAALTAALSTSTSSKNMIFRQARSRSVEARQFLAGITCRRTLMSVSTPLRRLGSATSSTAADSEARLFPEELNLIYDSKCNVCKIEMEFLRKRDLRLTGNLNKDGDKTEATQPPKLRFTDLEGNYDESDPKNGGVTYAKGMKSMHAITSKGEVMSGVPVFEKAYQQVRLGWIFQIYKIPGVKSLFNLLYKVFAKYRTLVSRGSSVDSLIEAFEAKKKLEEDKRQAMANEACSDENNSCAIKGNVKP